MKSKPRPDPKQVASDWGLPDWQDSKQYADHKTVGIDRWCWEFLRRSDVYRTFWRDEIVTLQQRHAALPQQVERLVAGQMNEQEAHALRLEIQDLPPDEAAPLVERLNGGQTPVGPMPDESLVGGGTRFGMSKAMQQFGLFHAIDPRKLDGVQPIFTVPVMEGVVDPDPHKVTVVLDIRLPDTPQLEAVRSILSRRRAVPQVLSLPKKQQHELVDGLLNKTKVVPEVPSPDARAHVALYANYLRVLDAKESGASYRTIAKVIFPDLSDRAGMKQVENFYNQACKLRDGGWRRLLPVLAGES